MQLTHLLLTIFSFTLLLATTLAMPPEPIDRPIHDCPDDKVCGHACCHPADICKIPSESLCCKPNRKVCGRVCCHGGDICQTPSKSLCCKPNKVCGPTCCGDSAPPPPDTLTGLERGCADPKIGLCCLLNEFACGGKCCRKGMDCQNGMCQHPRKTREQCKKEHPEDGRPCIRNSDCPIPRGMTNSSCSIGCCWSYYIG